MKCMAETTHNIPNLMNLILNSQQYGAKRWTYFFHFNCFHSYIISVHAAFYEPHAHSLLSPCPSVETNYKQAKVCGEDLFTSGTYCMPQGVNITLLIKHTCSCSTHVSMENSSLKNSVAPVKAWTYIP